MLTIDIERLSLEPGARVLDVGCGDGRHTRQTRMKPGIAAFALDLDKQKVFETAAALHTLAALTPEEGGAVPDAGPWGVLRGSAYELPFESGTFDCVIISEVLEHLEDDDAAIREISRVLRPGGNLAVSVPRRGPEAVCWALSHEYSHTPGGHVRIYNRRALRRKLSTHGYRVFASHFAHALHAPFWWLKCMVGLENDDSRAVQLYHKFLVWDMFRRPLLTRLLERVLNPMLGKSVVFYAVKG